LSVVPVPMMSPAGASVAALSPAQCRCSHLFRLRQQWPSCLRQKVSMCQVVSPTRERRTQLPRLHPPVQVVLGLIDDALLAAVLPRGQLLTGGRRLGALLIAAGLGEEARHVVLRAWSRSRSSSSPRCRPVVEGREEWVWVFQRGRDRRSRGGKGRKEVRKANGRLRGRIRQ